MSAYVPDDLGVKPYKGPTYSAAYVPTDDPASGMAVLLRAIGENVTGGFHPSFHVGPANVPPPMLPATRIEFLNPRPTGIVNMMVTPFDVSISIPVPKGVTQLTVYDAAGTNTVAITGPAAG
jgi:hypothetical protein